MFSRLLLLFVTVGFAEIFLLLKVGTKIGFWPTAGIIIVTAILGAALTKMQGAMVMMKAQTAMNEGRVPHAEVLDGLLIVVAGAVLLTPGFLTDAFGFSLLIPPVRAALRDKLAAKFKDKIKVVGPGGQMGSAGAGSGNSSWADDDDVIEAEVIESDSDLERRE